MDNLAIARILAEIGDLLEIKGENPFKIRAYRNAADTVVHETRQVAALTRGERLELQGIGKDLAAKIGDGAPSYWAAPMTTMASTRSRSSRTPASPMRNEV